MGLHNMLHDTQPESRSPGFAGATLVHRILDTPDGQVPDCLLTFSDRDAILVRDSADLRIQGASSGRYAAQVDLPTAVGDLPVDRGWVAVDVRSQGRSFTFANTRLEAEDAPAVQEAQAAELLAGPGGADVVIAVGAFNSAADGSTTSTYSRLTAPDAFQDAWTVATDAPGATCCQYPDLTNLISQLDSRIDLVLTRGPIRPLRADVVGTTPSQVTVPRWASDHAGVVATLRLQ